MYFSEAVVGDRVWDYVYGEGEVRQVDDILIHAVFLIKNIIEIDYHKNGKEYLSDSNQRLFYYDNRPIVITQDDLELDDSIEYNMCQSGEISQLCSDGKINKVNINIDIAGQTRKVRRETPEEELNRLSKTPLYSDLAIKKTPEDEKTLEERVTELESLFECKYDYE